MSYERREDAGPVYMLHGTTTHVKEWRDRVIEHYGSVLNFNDQRTINIMLGFLDRAINGHQEVLDKIYDLEAYEDFKAVFADDFQAAAVLRQLLCEELNAIQARQKELGI